jgi:hypothetical protein
MVSGRTPIVSNVIRTAPTAKTGRETAYWRLAKPLPGICTWEFSSGSTNAASATTVVWPV